MRARRQFDSLAMPHLLPVYRLARQLAGVQKAEDLAIGTVMSRINRGRRMLERLSLDRRNGRLVLPDALSVRQRR